MRHMFIVSIPELQLVRKETHHLVLPHLYHNPDYVEFYRTQSEAGAYLLQDNSIFELKEALEGAFLMDRAKEIGASCVMVPEVLRNATASLEAMTDFFKFAVTNSEFGSYEFAACVQGKTYEEVKEHYRILSKDGRIDVIAIPFNLEFDSIGVTNDRVKLTGWNRFNIIRKLAQDGVWDFKKRHHLLGLYSPVELIAYRSIPSVYRSIESNDSSSCFWHSLYGVKYSRYCGLPYRKIETHVDFFASYEHQMQYNLFKRNSKILKMFASGDVSAADLHPYAAFETKAMEEEDVSQVQD